MHKRTSPAGLTRWGGVTVWLALVNGLATGCQTPTAVPPTVTDGTVAISFPEQDAIALYFTQSRGTSTVSSFIGMALDLLKP